MLGPGGLDRFRNLLYRSPVGRSVIRGQLRYLIPGLAALAVAVLLFGGFMVVSHWHF